jgi:hypothetical protein
LCGIDLSLANPFGSKADIDDDDDGVEPTAARDESKSVVVEGDATLDEEAEVQAQLEAIEQQFTNEKEEGLDSNTATKKKKRWTTPKLFLSSGKKKSSTSKPATPPKKKMSSSNENSDNDDKVEDDKLTLEVDEDNTNDGGNDSFDMDKALDDLDIPASDDDDADDLNDDDDDEQPKIGSEQETKGKGGTGLFGSLRRSIVGDLRAKESSSKSEAVVTHKEEEEEKEEDANNDKAITNIAATVKTTSVPPQPQPKKSGFAATDVPFSDREAESMSGWTDRLRRDEVFSLRYRSNPEEADELNELAQHVTRGARPSIFGGSDYNSLMQLVTPDATLSQPHSIILKRGPVLLKTAKGGTKSNDCELVLMTHGFIVVNLEQPQDLGASFSKLMGMNKKSSYEVCKLWSMVDHAKDTTQSICSFSLGLNNGGEPMEFVVLSNPAKDAWMAALERILVQHAMHDPQRKKMTESLGWQYQLVHAPGYTAAVTGTVESLQDPVYPVTSSQLNKLDSYHRFAPLHYAIQQDPCNEEIIQSLLKAGADPNLPDGEDRTAMYYGTI